MRRLCHPCVSGARGLATAAFVQAVEQVQQQLPTAGERRAALTGRGRQLFEVETLSDIGAAFTPEVAGKVCHAAAQLRVSPLKGEVYQAVTERCLRREAVEAMDMASLARVLHSALVLHSPLLYELLVTYARPVIARVSTLDAVSTAVILNAYGRAGVRHEELYQSLCDHGATVLADPLLPLAHVANVSHALSRVHFRHPPLMLVLRAQAVRQAASAAPLVAVTVLDAFAELGMPEAELFDTYERLLLQHPERLSPPLIASFLASLVAAGRLTPQVLEAISDQIVAGAASYDPASVAKVCDAFFVAGTLSEEVLGAMAERACKAAGDLRADEMNAILNALSAFDLFDGELFPLLASRLSSLARQGGHVGAADAAGILASFAAVQERNEELLHVCFQVLAAHPGGAMPPAAYINALWACATLGARSQTQAQMVDYLKANPGYLTLAAPPESASLRDKKTAEVLAQRRELVVKSYAVS